MKKARKPNVYKAFLLELLTRIELVTSSLPNLFVLFLSFPSVFSFAVLSTETARVFGCSVALSFLIVPRGSVLVPVLPVLVSVLVLVRERWRYSGR